MWDRALFSVRRFWVDLGPNLGSWRLSVVLMVLAAFYYLFLAIWARSSPAHVVQNIASLAPYWIVYALLLVNTGVCLYRRLPALRADLDPDRTREVLRPDWEVALTDDGEEAGARALLRRAGYRLRDGGEGVVVGTRRRWAPLGTFLFHGAFFLVALGFLLTLAGRQEATVRVAVGEDFEGREDQFVSRSAPRPLATGVPPLAFRLDWLAPEFWGDELLFMRYEAGLTMRGGRSRTTKINSPLWIGAATFLRLTNYGYALRYELLDGAHALRDSAFVKLNLFPPGQTDYFVLPDLPHRAYVTVYPDYVEKDGVPGTASLRLVKPAVEVRLFRGRLDLGGGVLTSEKGLQFEGLVLRFPEVRPWAEMTIVFDPGAPVLFLGYLVGIWGLLLKIRGPRADVEWRPGTDAEPAVLRGWGPRPTSIPAAEEEA